MVYNSEEVKDPSFIILEDDVLKKMVFKKSDGSTLVVPLADLGDVGALESALSEVFVDPEELSAESALKVDKDKSMTVGDCWSSWWAGPKAVAVESEYNDRTYFTGVSRGGDQIVGFFDHRNQRTERHVIATIHATGSQYRGDDHSTPALVMNADRPPIFFYAGHGFDNYLRFKRGKAIGSIDAGSWEPEMAIEMPDLVTYAQVWPERASGTNTLLAICRSGSGQYWYYTRSTDWGVTWSTPVQLCDFGGQGGYVVGSKNPTADPSNQYDLRLAFVGHPTNSTFHDIYYAYVRMNSGDIKHPNGTTLGNYKTDASLPFLVTAASRVYQVPAGRNSRLFDVGGNTGASAAVNGVVVFMSWVTADDSDPTYHYAIYSAGVWTVRNIVAAGVGFGYTTNIHYNGGVVIPAPGNGNTIYLSREVGGVWHLEKYVTDNAGVSWTVTSIDISSDIKLVRPFCPINASEYKVLYHELYRYGSGLGDATGYTDYYGDLVGSEV